MGGDIVVSPSYVHRQMMKDKAFFEKDGTYNDAEDAGVSRVMASSFSLDERINLLLIHSVVHLLGYDHESQTEWLEMTAKEDEVMERLGILTQQDNQDSLLLTQNVSY